MLSSTAVPVFMFGTLGVVFIIALIVFLKFQSKKSNRHPMDGQRERNIDEIREEGPAGRN